MSNKGKIFIVFVVILILVIFGLIYYYSSVSSDKSDKEIVIEFLEKSHHVTKKDRAEFDVGSPIETAIERYEKKIRDEYDIYFSENGMVLAMANRDVDWLIQAAVNNEFNSIANNIILSLREENGDNIVYNYELVLTIQYDNTSTKEIKRQGYIQLIKENDKWLIDRCRIDQDLKEIIE